MVLRKTSNYGPPLTSAWGQSLTGQKYLVPLSLCTTHAQCCRPIWKFFWKGRVEVLIVYIVFFYADFKSAIKTWFFLACFFLSPFIYFFKYMFFRQCASLYDNWDNFIISHQSISSYDTWDNFIYKFVVILEDLE